MNSMALESIFSEHEKYRELRIIYIDNAYCNKQMSPCLYYSGHVCEKGIMIKPR